MINASRSLSYSSSGPCGGNFLAKTVEKLESYGEATARALRLIPTLNKHSEKNITLEDLTVLLLYTQATPITYYQQLNCRLKENRADQSKLSPWVRDFKTRLTHTLEKLAPHEEPVYRGTELLRTPKIDDTIRTIAFLSTSRVRSVAQKFYNGATSKARRYIIKFENHRSPSISFASALPAEAEVLIPPGRCFKVVKPTAKDSDIDFVLRGVQCTADARERIDIMSDLRSRDD